jgi:hypothetical protein
MWTAWEGSPMPWQKNLILGKGQSEISGMAGAPIAESYFTKVGGQMPDTLGFSINPFKSPSLFETTVKGFKTVPRYAKAGGTSKAQFASIDKFLQTKSEPGYAYMQMMKPEYEAVLPTGNVIGGLKSSYYTKIGGIKILGRKTLRTRASIYEGMATGETVKIGIKTIGRTSSGYSYRGPAMINIPSAALSSFSVRPGLKISSSKGYNLDASRSAASRNTGSPVSSARGSSNLISSSTVKSLSSLKSSLPSRRSSMISSSSLSKISSGISKVSSGTSLKSSITSKGSSGYSGISRGSSGGSSGGSGGYSRTSRNISYLKLSSNKYLWAPSKKKHPWAVKAKVKAMDWKITNPVPRLKGFAFKMPKVKK